MTRHTDPLDYSLALLKGRQAAARAGRFGPRGGYRLTQDEMARLIARLETAQAQAAAARAAITTMEQHA